MRQKIQPKRYGEIIGEDIDDMSVDLNPDVEKRKNILGKTKVNDKGYEPSISADPFYANPEYKLYPKIRDLALGRKKGDTCKSLMLEVIEEDTTAAKHLAYVQEVLVNRSLMAVVQRELTSRSTLRKTEPE